MKLFCTNAALLAVLFSFSTTYAAEREYAAGKIVTVEKKTHERVLYYLVNTPVTQDDPYYEITLQLADSWYLAEYTPRHAPTNFPMVGRMAVRWK